MQRPGWVRGRRLLGPMLAAVLVVGVAIPSSAGSGPSATATRPAGRALLGHVAFRGVTRLPAARARVPARRLGRGEDVRSVEAAPALEEDGGRAPGNAPPASSAVPAVPATPVVGST